MSLDGPQVGINECLYELSKDLKGELTLGQANDEKCERLNCTSFKTTHKLEAELSSHPQCDSKEGKVLDGRLIVKIVHGLINNGQGRGAHYGRFQLSSVSGTDSRRSIMGNN